jgi:hypothetical protein
MGCHGARMADHGKRPGAHGVVASSTTSEIIVDEVRESRWAERTGLYDALFATCNEGTG